MIEVNIKTGDKAIIETLLQLIQQIGLEVNNSNAKENIVQISVSTPVQTPNITWAENPESAKELFGIWKDEPRDINQLRNKAWGGRL